MGEASRATRRLRAALVAVGLLAQTSLAGAMPDRASHGAAPDRTSRVATYGRILATTIGSTLQSEGFSSDATTPNLWTAVGDACLTAGDYSTPTSSVPACKTAAPADAIGQGALQLTSGGGSQVGMVVLRVPLATSAGLHISFDDYSFKGTSPGSEGIAFFLTDASQPLPTTTGQRGAGMGYAGTPTAPGIANAYVGVGLDEYGGFSSSAGGYVGGPGSVPETIAVRGSVTTQYAYLGGATNSAGKPASLPFALDQPTAGTRPSNAPTISATLTPAGILTVAVDRHDGNGAVVYYTQSIVGIGGQPAVPANVYFGLSASTGTHTNTHQISGLVISTLAATSPPAATLIKESFSGSATAPNAWQRFGSACLTAGGSTTPSTSVPACGASASQDAPGSGALELTKGTTSQVGVVINKTPLSTANGLQITFTEDAFDGTTPGSEGVAFFLSDASASLPTHNGLGGGGLGYVGTSPTNGLPNGYLAVGFDEYGSFSSTSGGYTGGPGLVPETVAVRGAASIAYAYLGGATNSAGKAASLPFALDAPTATTRPTAGPTISATLTAAGALTVAIDHHDGNGFITYVSQSIVGVNGQPAVPANVYFGLSGSTGSHDEIHQISGLTVSTIGNVASSAAASDNPPQLVSSNGSLTFNVSAQVDPVTGNPAFNYNGSTVPPTLRLLPGDTLVVNLTNNLPTPPAGSGYTNATNLHYHGLHVSPSAPGDDSIDMLAEPGQSLHYLVRIPASHPPGLYWYHSHAHGEAERQTLSGMSGALVIDGIAAYTPAVASMKERILIARDAPLPGGVLPNADLRQIYAMTWAHRHGVAMHAASELHGSSTARTRNPYVRVDPRYKRFVRSQTTDQHCVAGSPEQPVKALTINGATQPTLQIAPGEQQFWRMVNAGADTYLDVQIDNAVMQIVAIDGVPVASGVGTPASVTVSDWVLPPASRVEFIVTGPPAGTTSYLRTNCFDSGAEGDPMPAAILAALTPPTGGNATMRRHSSIVARVSPHARRFVFHRVGLTTMRNARRTLAQIRAAGIAATRTLYYTDQNTINGIAYDPAAPPQFYAQTGTVEEWTISNSSNEVHTFHMHQVHFVVEAINGTTLAQQYVMDNVNVPAATQNGPGTVKLLLDFTDPTVIGTFLLHCHILSHEDGGMMAKIRIGLAPPLVPSSSNVSFTGTAAAAQTLTISGGAAPYSVTGCSGVAFAAVTGASVSVRPFGAGSCVLTIADASNPSLTAAVTVNVSAPPAVVTLGATSASFTAPTAPSQVVSIVGGTPPYTVSGCTNVAAGTVSGQTMTVTPIAVGICSLTVSDALNNDAQLSIGVNAPAVGNPLDNLTFHQNTQRTGWYRNESILTTAAVASPAFGPVASLTAPAGLPGLGKVYAQPLYVTNELAVDGQQHNLIIVAGAAGQVYAFDETTRAVVWHRDFTNPAAGIRQQLWTDTNCTDVQPDVGIMGTPVIDRTLDAIYVVVATEENGVPYTRLHAIGLGSGSDLLPPTVISGTVNLATGGTASINSRFNMNRSALLEANGNIYVAFGSHCDAGLAFTHGWLVAYNATTLAQAGSLIDTSNANDGTGLYLGSIWMGGFGPAADAAGNIYFATGNGPFNGTTNFSMSILKVPGNLDLAGASFFTPAQEAVDSQSDRDVSSAGVLLFPDQSGPFPHLLVGGGKCSVPAGCYKYILNRDALGGQQPGNAGALWSADTAGSLFGGPAYFADSSGTQHIVYGSGSPGYPLSTYTLSLAPIGLTIESSANVGRLAGRDAGSTPIVSSNGTMPGTAIVWALKTPGNSGGQITLYAFDALNMNSVLYSGVIGSWNQLPGTAGIGEALISPVIANGLVYVPSDGMVMVLGLH